MELNADREPAGNHPSFSNAQNAILPCLNIHKWAVIDVAQVHTQIQCMGPAI